MWSRRVNPHRRSVCVLLSVPRRWGFVVANLTRPQPKSFAKDFVPIFFAAVKSKMIDFLFAHILEDCGV